MRVMMSLAHVTLPIAHTGSEPDHCRMKTHFRLVRLNSAYHVLNKGTGELKPLPTTDRGEAQKLVQTYNDTVNQSALNIELAHIHMAAADPELHTRTWQDVMNYMVKRRRGENHRRWSVAIKNESFDSIRHL